jgi:hypothetical protein
MEAARFYRGSPHRGPGQYTSAGTDAWYCRVDYLQIRFLRHLAYKQYKGIAFEQSAEAENIHFYYQEVQQEAFEVQAVGPL